MAWTAWATYGGTIADLLQAGSTPVNAGSWGDTFGALNTLFSGLAFSGVLATLWLQGRALSEQQRDQHRQQFEGTFFELLNLMRELKGEVRFRLSADYRVERGLSGSSITKHGTSAIREAVIEARFWVGREGNSPRPIKERVGDIYKERVHVRYESNLGPYFRVIYTILHRIRSDKVLTAEEKCRYGNLLRSQLTSHEVSLCGLNGLSPISKDFFDLVVFFRLLKYLPEGSMRKILVAYYPPEAFLARD